MRALRRGLQIALLGSIGLVLASFALLFALLASDAFLARVVPWGAEKAGFDVAFEDIRHDLGSELVIDGLRVRGAGARPEEPSILSAEQLALRYRPWPVLIGRELVVALDLRAPKLALLFDDEGRLPWLPPPSEEVLPVVETPSASGPLVPRLPIALRLDALAITQGEVRVVHPPSKTDLRIAGLGLGATAVTAEASADARLDVEEIVYGKARVGPLGVTARARGSVLELSPLTLALADGKLGLDASFDASNSDVAATLTLEALELGPLLTQLGVEAEVPSPLSARLSAEGRVSEQVRGTLQVDGIFRERALDVSGSASVGATRVQGLVLRVGWAGLDVEAKGDVDLEARESDLLVLAKSTDLGFLAALAPGAGVQGGALNAELAVAGDPSAPRVELRRLTIPRVQASQLTFSAVSATARFDTPTGALALDARIEDVMAQKLALGSASVEAKGDLAKLALQLGVGQAIRAAGSYESEASRVDLDLTVKQLRLDPWLAIAGLERFRGMVDDLHGSVRGPVGDLTKLAADLQLTGLALRGEGVEIRQARPMAITLAEGVGRAKGDLAIGTGGLRFDARGDLGARTMKATADGQLDLAEFEQLARAFVPELRALTGRIAFDAKANGALDDPRIEAKGTLSALALRQGGAGTSAASAEAGSKKVIVIGDAAVERPEGTEQAAAGAAPFDGLEATLPSLTFSLSGPPSRLTGEAALDGGRVVVAGRQVRDVTARVGLASGAITLERASLFLEDLAIEARGNVTPSGALSAEIRSVDGRLEQLPDLAKLGMSGALALRVDASGTTSSPVAKLAFDVPALLADERDLGALGVEASVRGTQAEVKGTLPGGGTLQATASLGTAPRFESALSLSNFALTPYLDMVREQLPLFARDAAGTISLDVSASGPIDDPEAVRAAVVLGALDLTLAATPIRLEQSTTMRLDRGRFELELLRLDIAGSKLALTANGDAEKVHAVADLDIDPATIDPFVPRATFGEGQIRGRVELDRDEAGLRSTGALDARISSLEVSGYSSPITDIELALKMDGTKTRVESLKARVGEGSVTAAAEFDLQTQEVSDATLSFVQVPYRIPRTLRALASGDLRVNGSLEEELVIAGTVRLDEALYEKDVSLAGAVLMPLANPDAKQTEGGGEAASPLLEHIRFDLKLQQGDDIRIRNNVAQMAIGLDLALAGTAASPRLQGNVNVQEGSVKLFGRAFEIQRGAISFNNPVRIDPNVDIETLTVFEREAIRTEVRLHLEGLASEGIALKLSSVPSYDDADILFLLATGKTRAEALAGGQGAGSPSGKAAALAALNLLAKDYAKKTFGVDEIAAEENEAGNVTVTVGKQINERMGVRASSELGSQVNTAFAVEYKLTNNALVVAKPKDDGSVSLVLQLRLPIR